MVDAQAGQDPLLVVLVKGSESAWIRRQAMLLPVVGVLWLVFTALAAVRVSDGRDYRYPLTIRMVG